MVYLLRVTPDSKTKIGEFFMPNFKKIFISTFLVSQIGIALTSQTIQTRTPYKNIIFDLGGPLMDENVAPVILETITHKLWNAFKEGTFLKTLWYLPEEIKSLGDFVESNCKGIPLDQAAQEAVEKAEERLHRKPLYSVKKEDILDLFKRAEKYAVQNMSKKGVEIFTKVKENGYKTYLLSNVGQEQWEYLAQQKAWHDIFDQFDGLVLSYQIKMAKPEPQIYRYILEKYNLKPEESIFIDDRIENIEAAKKLGIDAILCDNHDHVIIELKKRKIL